MLDCRDHESARPPARGQDRGFRLSARLSVDLRARSRGARRPQHRPRARRGGQSLYGRRDLREGRALRRAHPSSRSAAASDGAQGAEGLGAVRADLLGRRARSRGGEIYRRRGKARQRGRVALLLRRHHGPDHARRHQPPAPCEEIFRLLSPPSASIRPGPASSPAPASSPVPIRARWRAPTSW